jgi:hypothetical protein
VGGPDAIRRNVCNDPVCLAFVVVPSGQSERVATVRRIRPDVEKDEELLNAIKDRFGESLNIKNFDGEIYVADMRQSKLDLAKKAWCDSYQRSSSGRDR